MGALHEYIAEVLTELKRDDEFIKSLKATLARQVVPIASIERMADEWLATQKGLKPNEQQVARRLAVDKFPELLEKSRGDQAAAKRALFSVLSGFVKRRPK
jgi:hypothetical protein